MQNKIHIHIGEVVGYRAWLIEANQLIIAPSEKSGGAIFLSAIASAVEGGLLPPPCALSLAGTPPRPRQ
jgi:hypothetical protein